jgi:hypothetical protein
MIRTPKHILGLALAVCIVAFGLVLTGPAYADDGGGKGCLGENSSCTQEPNGRCALASNPDRCVCANLLNGDNVGTCDCSTREFPPCSNKED